MIHPSRRCAVRWLRGAIAFWLAAAGCKREPSARDAQPSPYAVVAPNADAASWKRVDAPPPLERFNKADLIRSGVISGEPTEIASKGSRSTFAQQEDGFEVSGAVAR